MTRNSLASLRNPEVASVGRPAGFKQQRVGSFCDVLKTALNKREFDAASNMDETSLIMAQTLREDLAI